MPGPEDCSRKGAAARQRSGELSPGAQHQAGPPNAADPDFGRALARNSCAAGAAEACGSATKLALPSSSSSSSSASSSGSKKARKEAARREAVLQAFSAHYAAQYGKRRWEGSLLPALRGPQRYCCLVNTFAERADVARALAPVLERMELCSYFRNPRDPAMSLVCYQEKERRPAEEDGEGPDRPAPGAEAGFLPFPRPSRDARNLATHYLLDLSSLLATQALDVAPHHRVLDTCSAPGGKALALAMRLGPSGRLHVNEPNGERRKHLRRVLDEYLPAGMVGSGGDVDAVVSVGGVDVSRHRAGDRFPCGAGGYDRVLVDAPCSGERHLLRSPADLARWTPARAAALAKKQRLILAEALRACAPGGRVVYATCSLSAAENDAVVEWAAASRRAGGGAVIDCERPPPRAWPVGETTRLGWAVLPDTAGRWGPLYFAVLLKRKDGARRTAGSRTSASDGEEEEEEDVNCSDE
ncbi:MAG: S-adenosyl-L-methionine-dependent methyltransferase [Olpidium bornovanus]|uniref:NOL1/NOP2/Sun domain family member 4 n=1 Tax=Olpidium bornovanus TaxID=278681 RepID=A0A8H8DKB6_9FUNG|nr:MAG: S-adenosyl-L-methionine-dependent methyltransferase [Olpidium bornovanus]